MPAILPGARGFATAVAGAPRPLPRPNPFAPDASGIRGPFDGVLEVFCAILASDAIACGFDKFNNADWGMTAPWFPVHLPPRSFAPSKEVSKMTSRKSPCTPTTAPLDPKGGESVDPANTTLSPTEKDPPEKMAIRPP